MQDGELMAQHENLGVFGTLASAAQQQQIDYKPDETVETGHAPILIDPGRTDRIEPVTGGGANEQVDSVIRVLAPHTRC